MRQLTVCLRGEKVGILQQDDGGLLGFSYNTEWLQRKDAIPLSKTLPLISEPFIGKRVRPFFSGILPEQEPRAKIASILGISERNDFAMLEKIGGECAGAITILPEAQLPELETLPSQRLLTGEELIAIVENLHQKPLMAGEAGIRLSLAGAQDKCPLIYKEGLFSLPLGSMPSTHILKPEPDRFPGLVVNEYLCLSLARSIGLPVPEVQMMTIGSRKCLLVHRYDRIETENGGIARLHQEDFCQALGFPPEKKYQEEGGPTLKNVITLIREWSSAPVLDLRQMIDGLIFNAVIGNADAHGKNFSFLYSNGEKRMAPFYDLVCTLAWPELSANFSMMIGEAKNLQTLTLSHWKKMSKDCKLGFPLVKERMAKISTLILQQIEGLATNFTGNDLEISSKCSEIITHRAEEVKNELE